MRDNMGVACCGPRITPAPGSNKPLQIGAAEPSHPRRPRMAERVKRQPGESIWRDHHAVSALRPANWRQTASRDLGVEENEIPVTALTKPKYAPRGLYKAERG